MTRLNELRRIEAELTQEIVERQGRLRTVQTEILIERQTETKRREALNGNGIELPKERSCEESS